MNRRSFLGDALRLAATVAGAAVLVAPLDPQRCLPAPPPRLLVDPNAAAWAKPFTHKRWELGIEISQEALEDDLYGLYQQMARQLGTAPSRLDRLVREDCFGTA